MTNKVTRTTPGLIDSREVRSIDENNNYTYYPNVDYMYGPYESVEAAYNALAQETDNIGATALVKGKTVGVIEDGKIVEYWFESDPADATAGYQAADLVKKGSDVVDLSDYVRKDEIADIAKVFYYNSTVNGDNYDQLSNSDISKTFIGHLDRQNLQSPSVKLRTAFVKATNENGGNIETDNWFIVEVQPAQTYSNTEHTNMSFSTFDAFCHEVVPGGASIWTRYYFNKTADYIRSQDPALGQFIADAF